MDYLIYGTSVLDNIDQVDRIWYLTSDLDEAKDLVLNNRTDIAEGGSYPYLVIQPLLRESITIEPDGGEYLIYKYNKETKKCDLLGTKKMWVSNDEDLKIQFINSGE